MVQRQRAQRKKISVLFPQFISDSNLPFYILGTNQLFNRSLALYDRHFLLLVLHFCLWARWTEPHPMKILLFFLGYRLPFTKFSSPSDSRKTWKCPRPLNRGFYLAAPSVLVSLKRSAEFFTSFRSPKIKRHRNLSRQAGRDHTSKDCFEVVQSTAERLSNSPEKL